MNEKILVQICEIKNLSKNKISPDRGKALPGRDNYIISKILK